MQGGLPQGGLPGGGTQTHPPGGSESPPSPLTGSARTTRNT